MRMRYADALAESKKICRQYDLCDPCLGRLFAKNLALASPRRLGARLRRDVGRVHKKCYVCRGLFDSLGRVGGAVAESAHRYEFESFLIGVTMRPSVVDRDDFMRSKFQLLGAESAKSALAGELSKGLTRRTGAVSKISAPDLSLTVNLRTDSVHARSRPAHAFGRYVKKKRGLPQKLPRCPKCGGSGCAECFGTDSVEMRISKYLLGAFGAEGAKITWIGGEDGSSLVLGNGRPFFAQMINPKKRTPAMPRRTTLKNGLLLSGPKAIQSAPKMPVKFRSVIAISVKSEEDLDPARLRGIKKKIGSVIAVYEKLRRNEKTVYSVKYRKSGPRSVLVTLEADGGLPVKKFVAGDTVFPNMADMMGTGCTCSHFDFYGVKVTT